MEADNHFRLGERGDCFYCLLIFEMAFPSPDLNILEAKASQDS